jgi:hypothetical protein
VPVNRYTARLVVRSANTTIARFGAYCFDLPAPFGDVGRPPKAAMKVREKGRAQTACGSWRRSQKKTDVWSIKHKIAEARKTSAHDLPETLTLVGDGPYSISFAELEKPGNGDSAFRDCDRSMARRAMARLFFATPASYPHPSRCNPSSRSRSCLNFDCNSFATSAVIPVA